MVRSALPSNRQVKFLQNKALAQMNFTVTISRPQGQTFNPTTGMINVVHGTQVYTGKALIHSSVSGVPLTMGDGIDAIRSFSVSIPHFAPLIHREDLVKVIDGPGPSALIGKMLRVIDVQAGSPLEAVSNKLVCTDVQAGVFNP